MKNFPRYPVMSVAISVIITFVAMLSLRPIALVAFGLSWFFSGLTVESYRCTRLLQSAMEKTK